MAPTAALVMSALLALSAVQHASAARDQVIPTATVAGTNVLRTDVTSRTGTAGVVQNQIQAGARGGRTTDVVGSLARTRQAGNANTATRTAVGNNAAQSAVRTAARTGNAAGATAAGSGIAQVVAQGRGQTIPSAGTRSSMAQTSTSAAIQSAARGATSARTATAAGQTNARASQFQTSHRPGGVGRRLL